MRKIRSLFIMLVACLSVSGCATSQSSQSNDDTLSIAVVQYAQHPALDSANEGFKAALSENGYDESKVTLEDYNAQNDASNVETIANTVVTGRPDLIFAIATPVAQGVAQKTSDIPIVVSAVTDPAASGLVDTNELPGGNVTGTSDAVDTSVMVDLLASVKPDATNVGIMYCSSEDNSRIQAESLKTLLTEKGYNVTEFSASDSASIQQVAESAKGKVDAMMIPTDNLMAESMPLVAQILNDAGIVSVVGEPALCENGGTVSKGINYYDLGYQAGLMAIEILEGNDPASMPVYFVDASNLQLTINQESVDSIGLSLPDGFADNATIYGQ